MVFADVERHNASHNRHWLLPAVSEDYFVHVSSGVLHLRGLQCSERIRVTAEVADQLDVIPVLPNHLHSLACHQRLRHEVRAPFAGNVCASLLQLGGPSEDAATCYRICTQCRTDLSVIWRFFWLKTVCETVVAIAANR